MCIFVICVGTTETVEGGNQLPAGLCPLVVFCQSAWRRAGEMLAPCILMSAVLPLSYEDMGLDEGSLLKADFFLPFHFNVFF